MNKYNLISRITLTGAATMMAALGAMPGASAATIPMNNLLANAGFESAITQGSCCGQSVGNWLSYVGWAGSTAPFTQSTVKHSGNSALAVQTDAGYATGAVAYQDYPNFPGGTSFKLSAWGLPQQGDDVLEVIHGWDRGNGNDLGYSRIIIYPNSIVANAWGTTATFPTATNQYYGSWHHFMLKVNANTHRSTVVVDGVVLGQTPAGTALPAAPATVVVGRGEWDGPASTFYWDQVKLALN